MEQAKRTLKELKETAKHITSCENNYNFNKICFYNPFSTKFAIATIKIYELECSEYHDFRDVVSFTEYIEDDVIKQFPYKGIGFIPNYTFIIGNERQFETTYKEYRQWRPYDTYYNIPVRIPFSE